jgi:hypothetical protein
MNEQYVDMVKSGKDDSRYDYSLLFISDVESCNRSSMIPVKLLTNFNERVIAEILGYPVIEKGLCKF